MTGLGPIKIRNHVLGMGHAERKQETGNEGRIEQPSLEWAQGGSKARPEPGRAQPDSPVGKSVELTLVLGRTGLDAQQGVGGAPAEGSGDQRDDTNPAPNANNAGQRQGNQDQADDGPQRTV